MEIQKYDLKLTEEVKYLLSLAAVGAQSRGCYSIGSEHILMAMVFNKQSRVCKILYSAEATVEEINIKNDLLFTPQVYFRDDTSDFQDDAILVIEEAIRIADVWNHEVTSVHFLMSILEHVNKESKANLILESLKIDRIKLARKVINNLKLQRIKPPPLTAVKDDFAIEGSDLASIDTQYETETPAFTATATHERKDVEFKPQVGSWFSKKAEEIIAEASALAKDQKVKFITDAHLFEAIVGHKFIPTVEHLKSLVNVGQLTTFFYKSDQWNSSLGPHGSLFSGNTMDTLGNARQLMESLGQDTISPDMILISILRKKPMFSIESDSIPKPQKDFDYASRLNSDFDLADFSGKVNSTHTNRLASILLDKLLEPVSSEEYSSQEK